MLTPLAAKTDMTIARDLQRRLLATPSRCRCISHDDSELISVSTRLLDCSNPETVTAINNRHFELSAHFCEKVKPWLFRSDVLAHRAHLGLSLAAPSPHCSRCDFPKPSTKHVSLRRAYPHASFAASRIDLDDLECGAGALGAAVRAIGRVIVPYR
jgi:hypothetical protein